MTFDEFNKTTHDLTMAYGNLVKWNAKLRSDLLASDKKWILRTDERDEARRLAEYLQETVDMTVGGAGCRTTSMPWEVEK